VLNGANEIAVQAFLDGRIGYLGIPRLVKEVLEGHRPQKVDTIEDVMQSDRWSRRAAEEMLSMRVFS
jgi:1-deoxy-D-xylulose-5-phosphate reductoisomerase